MNKFTFRRFLSALNIRSDSDKEYAIENLKGSIYIKGANLWYLVSSAILASIGLDTNSPAVIIGAMLISPLMSPILGIGLSVGIYDKELLLSSVKEFLFAVLLSLFISTLYFLISPLAVATNELVGRTTPTLLDIGVAFFGGIAGIVAATRKGIVNSIPGVAIATALMPPICTAGFGIATGNATFFGGAFYLFFINAVFISLSAVLIVRYLKFPVKIYVDKVKKGRIRRIILFFTFVVSVPGAVIFWGIIKDADEQKKLKILIADNFEGKNRGVVNWRLTNAENSKILRVYYTGNVYRAGEEDSLRSYLKNNFGNVELRLQHLDQAHKIETIENRIDREIEDKIKNIETDKSLLEERVRKLESGNFINPADTIELKRLQNELSIFYPSVREIYFNRDEDSGIEIETKSKMNKDDKTKLEMYVKYRVNSDSLRVFFK